jgi:hypothetical protein
MKRTDLIRELEEQAASSFATAGITTGIGTPRPEHLNLFPVTVRSTSSWQNTF